MKQRHVRTHFFLIFANSQYRRSNKAPDLQDFVELFLVFHNHDVGLTALSHIATSFGRVGGVNSSCQAPTAQISLHDSLCILLICQQFVSQIIFQRQQKWLKLLFYIFIHSSFFFFKPYSLTRKTPGQNRQHWQWVTNIRQITQE